ncbi:hypothetical protein QBC34DRAFT_108317 [Podospora aff. communis PSN243]|uniref:Uncharacterized protein n=1 Tax=Podospora aff. communis PSN243 TaxID=3040156 RepID=A0AAV9H5Z4_9PEZI|nr:hypothetical protein QBC34DRAFT_108317 [Podospora aff. communis PSN243]
MKWRQRIGRILHRSTRKTVEDDVEHPSEASEPSSNPSTLPSAYHESRWPEMEEQGCLQDVSSEFGRMRVFLLGAKGVGKRSLLFKYIYDDMDGGLRYQEARHDPTGLDETQLYRCGEYFLSMEITKNLKYAEDCYIDTASAVGVILAYDVHSRDSLAYISRIHDILRNELAGSVGRDPGTPGQPPMPFEVVMLGLKADSDSSAVGERVPKEEGERCARERHCRFAECSAKTGEGVQEVFASLAQRAVAVALSMEPEQGWKKCRNRIAFKDSQDMVARALNVLREHELD